MAKKAKKLPPETDWFPCSVKPVHVGMYKRKTAFSAFSPPTAYSYWNGLEWFAYNPDFDMANGNFKNRIVSAYQSLEWRGLTEEVKA